MRNLHLASSASETVLASVSSLLTSAFCLLPFALVLFLTATGCRGSHETMLIDLVRELPRAFVQAPAASPGARADLVPSASGVVPALVMSAPSRVTWTLQFTERAELAAEVALAAEQSGTTGDGVTLRIGISDNRSYDELLRVRLDKPAHGAPPAWRPILVDLGAFSGWKWSLFYQPSRLQWKLIINTDATPGGTAAWQGLVVRARSS